jgi:uncharacterized protein YfaS (alpha-2-macroglobulin family)
MKTTAALFAALSTFASFLPAAELIVEPETLAPTSTIEVRFDKPMISKEIVGTVDKKMPLVINPAVEGEFAWASTRSGTFRFTKAPAMGTEYSFSLRKGMKDAEGKAVAVEDLGSFQTEAFALVDHERDYPYGYGNSAQRMPRYLLQFNDAVSADAVSKECYFETSDHAQRVAAKARVATGKDFKKIYNRSGELMWEERLKTNEQPVVKGDETRANALIVEAADLLPIGTMWKLIMPQSLTNLSGQCKLAPDQALEWGTIKALAVTGVQAQPHFDRAHAISVTFNKTLTGEGIKPEDAAARVTPFVVVDPPVANLKIEAGYSNLAISGDFALEQPYKLTLKKALASADDLGLENEVGEILVFHPSPAFISTSASTSSQMSTGKGIFDIYAANFKNLQVRVKQLTDGQLLQARDLVTEFQNIYKPEDRAAALKKQPFTELPGKAVFEKSFTNSKPLEKATLLTLNWHEILGQTPAAPVVVEIEADPQEGAPAGRVMTRAVVEFTDIGLVLKGSGSDALIHAFSLKTGAPMPGVQLTFTDVARGLLGQAQTDAQGLATLPTKDAAWLLAKSGTDCTTLDFSDNGSRIGLWHFGLNVAYDSPWTPHTQTFIFSDRPVYKPGDTAHIKAIARTLSGDTFSIGDKPRSGKLSLHDTRGREVLTKNITFTANGTWADDITLPDGATGWYDLSIDYKPERTEEERNKELTDDGSVTSIQLRVDDYKPNTFEVAIDGKKFESQADRVKVPLKARYYMGKGLSSAKANWSASLSLTWTPPEPFAEYHFGDVPSWWHYAQDRDEDNAAEEDEETGVREWGAHGELTLKADGTASIEMPPPPLHKAALPQTVTVYADVTDVNQQTISATTEFQLPGADYIVGVKKNRWYATAGQPVDFEFAAITPKGEPFTAGAGVDVKIERQQWNTVRVESAGNAATVKNQATLIEVQKAAVQLVSNAGKAASATLSFTPKDGGTYFLTATSKDASGKTILSRVPFYVISGNGFPWAWDEGSKMKLEPDKTSLVPGETASIVVKTPIAGNALVTVERNRVMRQFLVPISPENPIVKVPITEEDAPNCFVSVMVLRGADQNPGADKMPAYKLGYCELTVDSDKRQLFVDVESTQAEARPGTDIVVSAKVTDSAKAPVEGAEVTLYAVDEGVLSLMAYQTPAPFEFFHAAKALAVSSFTTLDNLIDESLDNRTRGNKGTIVGGGGDEGNADDALRKNFVATAVWSAALITDKDGRVITPVKVPDSLTRYRIMAIAVKGADRFGDGESAFTVNKPLMIEPVVPRFAHVGDEILVKGVLHNTTPHSGQVEVELKLDDSATLISEARPYALIGLKNRTMTNDGKTERRLVNLKAGETAALAFPVRFTKQGSCVWQWRVRTTEWPDKALTDAVESKFEITHAAPALREIHYFQLTSASAKDDLMKGINPQLLESDGSMRLDFNQSRMSECRDAMEYLLHYPYGCVEQTTSSMLPWLALSKYEPMFPDMLQKDKVRDAIRRGTDRLLQMQTDEGGLSYWPGGNQPLLWASAYGGFALVKAKEWGIQVPQASIDKLTDWISKDLRELDLNSVNETYPLCDAALALYTLAKAGKPEAAYQDLLFMRRDKLPETSRLFLALAMCLTNAPEKQITELLAKPKSEKWERYWLGPNTAAGLRLIVCAHLGLTKEMNLYADDLLKSRNSRGHWGTTFSNSWILLGLSAAERTPKDAAPLTMSLTWGDKKSDLTLTTPLTTATAVQDYGKSKGASKMFVSLPQGQTVRGRSEVKAFPDLKTYKPVMKGFGIKRHYERLTPTGQMEPATNLRVGDLIVVNLDIDVQKPNRYLALEDPLPSVFEPVNPEFTTQNKRADAKALDNEWLCDHRELRNDKALFFTDEVTEKGQFQLRYLARVIAEGDVIAPPARIEAMYEPDQYGLSDIQRVQTLPMTDGKDVADQ